MEVEVTTTWIEATTLLLLSTSLPDAPSPSPSSFEVNNNNTIPGDNIIDLITKFQLSDVLISWYIDHIRSYFVTAIAPRFWRHFADFEKIAQGGASGVHRWVDMTLPKAVGEIYDSVVKFESIRDSLVAALHKSLLKLQHDNSHHCNHIHFQPREMLRVALFTEEANRSTFHKILFLFFLRHFVSFNKQHKPPFDPNSDSDSSGDASELNEELDEIEESSSTMLLAGGDKDDVVRTMHSPSEGQLADLCAKLRHLDLLVISEEIFTEILFDQIEGYISARCKGKYHQSLMLKIQHWANVVLFEWLKLVICLDNKSSQKDDKNFRMFQQWKTRLEFNIYETFANLRICEIFELIVDFPDSTPALLDLQACLLKTSQHSDLVAALKQSNVQRLLHPGANTSDIISQYISTIKAMRLIDPSGVILDDVGDPIRNYLRQREDTIRCIVTSFTTDDEAQHTELFEEFRRGKNRLDKHGGYDGEDDDNDDDDDDAGDSTTDDEDATEKTEAKKWQPDPMEASPSKSRHRKQDTISMLVNIYGSSELFVNEYRNMLADRLIAVTDYDVDKEVRNLELLKLRFEESSLHNCEIMLKDMADSKRTNALIKKACRHRDGGNDGDGGNPNGNSDGDGTGGTELSLDMIIVSHLFWPTIKEESLTLPEPVQQQFDQYSKQYEHVKGTRKLIRKPHLGSVDLVLQFGPESSLSFTVSPAHAAIIYLFQDDQIRLGLSTIGSRVGLGVSAVRSKLVFWLNMRVLHEPAKDTFQLSQAAVQGQLRPAVPVGDTPATTTSTTTHPAMMLVAEEEAQPTTSAVAAQLEESMLVWERFIVNMLGSRGGCSLEVIHTALGFLLPGYSASPSDLKALLQKLIREDKVELDGSEYAKK